MGKQGRPVKHKGVNNDFIILDSRVQRKEMTVMDAVKELGISVNAYYDMRKRLQLYNRIEHILEDEHISQSTIDVILESVRELI